MPTDIQSPLHFRTLLTSHTYLIADFHATWCPPCKQIAPIFLQLSTAHSSKDFSFVKINVDEQRELAGLYGVTAMPTFLLYRNGKKVSEVRGADVRGLRGLVEDAAKELGKKAAGVKPKVMEKKAPESKVEAKDEKKAEVEGKTVSGSYGMTGGNNWKMSLN